MKISARVENQSGRHAMLSVLDGRWKGTSLWHLADGPMRTGGLRRSIPGITERC